MYYWLKALLTPTCWVQNERYSSAWDAELRRLLKTERFSNIGEYTAEIGGRVLWIENHPYASFTPYKTLKVRPSRATILRAYDRLLSDHIGTPNNRGG